MRLYKNYDILIAENGHLKARFNLTTEGRDIAAQMGNDPDEGLAFYHQALEARLETLREDLVEYGEDPDRHPDYQLMAQAHAALTTAYE